MTDLEITCVSIAAVGLGALAIGLARVVGSAKLKTGRQRLKGFSVYDLRLTIGGGAGGEPPKTEASVYLTIKTTPREPSSAAKMLFDEKVRRLGE